eukprot:gene8618-34061_t
MQIARPLRVQVKVTKFENNVRARRFMSFQSLTARLAFRRAASDDEIRESDQSQLGLKLAQQTKQQRVEDRSDIPPRSRDADEGAGVSPDPKDIRRALWLDDVYSPGTQDPTPLPADLGVVPQFNAAYLSSIPLPCSPPPAQPPVGSQAVHRAMHACTAPAGTRPIVQLDLPQDMDLTSPVSVSSGDDYESPCQEVVGGWASPDPTSPNPSSTCPSSQTQPSPSYEYASPNTEVASRGVSPSYDYASPNTEVASRGVSPSYDYASPNTEVASRGVSPSYDYASPNTEVASRGVSPSYDYASPNTEVASRGVSPDSNLRTNPKNPSPRRSPTPSPIPSPSPSQAVAHTPVKGTRSEDEMELATLARSVAKPRGRAARLLDDDSQDGDSPQKAKVESLGQGDQDATLAKSLGRAQVGSPVQGDEIATLAMSLGGLQVDSPEENDEFVTLARSVVKPRSRAAGRLVDSSEDEDDARRHGETSSKDAGPRTAAAYTGSAEEGVTTSNNDNRQQAGSLGHGGVADAIRQVAQVDSPDKNDEVVNVARSVVKPRSRAARLLAESSEDEEDGQPDAEEAVPWPLLLMGRSGHLNADRSPTGRPRSVPSTPGPEAPTAGGLEDSPSTTPSSVEPVVLVDTAESSGQESPPPTPTARKPAVPRRTRKPKGEGGPSPRRRRPSTQTDTGVGAAINGLSGLGLADLESPGSPAREETGTSAGVGVGGGMATPVPPTSRYVPRVRDQLKDQPHPRSEEPCIDLTELTSASDCEEYEGSAAVADELTSANDSEDYEGSIPVTAAPRRRKDRIQIPKTPKVVKPLVGSPKAKDASSVARTATLKKKEVASFMKLPSDLTIQWNPRLLSTAGQVLDDGSKDALKTAPSQRIPTRLELSCKVLGLVLGSKDALKTVPSQRIPTRLELSCKVLELGLGGRGGAGAGGSKDALKTVPSQRIPTRLELSCKVTGYSERLRHTLSHEMCHVAAWSIDREYFPHHGHAFWRWAEQFRKANLGVEITRLHSFQTFAPFRWHCTNPACAKVFSRHRKTIDEVLHRCGTCQGHLRFKSHPPGTPHGTIMKAISTQWTASKIEAQNLAGSTTPLSTPRPLDLEATTPRSR